MMMKTKKKKKVMIVVMMKRMNGGHSISRLFDPCWGSVRHTRSGSGWISCIVLIIEKYSNNITEICKQMNWSTKQWNTINKLIENPLPKLDDRKRKNTPTCCHLKVSSKSSNRHICVFEEIKPDQLDGGEGRGHLCPLGKLVKFAI